MSKSAKQWVRSLDDPDNIGASEYRAIHEVLEGTASEWDSDEDEENEEDEETEIVSVNEEQEQERFRLLEGILDEFIEHAKALKESLISERGD